MKFVAPARRFGVQGVHVKIPKKLVNLRAKSADLGVASASASALISSRFPRPLGGRMVHTEHRPPTGESSHFRRRREHPSTPLFRTIALLDSTPMDIKSGGQHAGDVRGVGVGCDRRDLFLMAASGRVSVPGEVSCAVGAFTVLAVTCSDGALLQHAVSARLACNLLRFTVG